jgi:uncharacterized protein (TIGR02118 family)
MIKVTVVLRRRAALSVERFQGYWLEHHAPLVARLPGLRRYVQSHTLASGYRKREPAADGIAELWFDDLAALKSLAGTTELAAVLADEAHFVAAQSQTLTGEHVIKDGAIPAGGLKNIEFVKKRSAMAVADFQHYWRTVHGPLGASIPSVQRYVQCHTQPGAYARATAPAYDGFALTWFVDLDAMRESARSPQYAATRADEDNFLSVPLAFIITREHVIVSRSQS